MMDAFAAIVDRRKALADAAANTNIGTRPQPTSTPSAPAQSELDEDAILKQMRAQMKAQKAAAAAGGQ